MWQIETGSLGSIRWAQWIDRAAFDAWQWRLKDLYALAFIDHGGTARAPVLEWAARERLAARGAAVDPSSIALEVYALVGGQFQFLRDVWECLGMMMRALNQPAFACPSYVRAWVGLMGANRTAPLGPWVDEAEGYASRESVRVREGRRCEPPRDGVTICEVDYQLFPVPRISLASNATLVDPLLRAIDAPAPSQGVDARWPRDAEGHYLGAMLRGAPYATFDAYAGAEWWPPAGAAARLGVVNVLMPGFASLQMAHAVAVTGQLLRRSWSEVAARSRLYCISQNIAQAAKYGGSEAEDIARINAEFEVLRYTATESEQLFGAVVEQFATFASALGSPLFGALVRGVQVGAEALLDGVGRAQARELDPFGRLEPVFEPWWIGGTISDTARRAPEFTVPAAPPVDPSAYPLAAAPGPLPSASVRLPVLVLPSLGGAGSGGGGGVEELDPASVAAEAARLWGVDPRRGL